jgi:DNA-binding NarL/FixJ family response regulator
MKADPKLKTIPVVVLTSSRETPDLIECYEHGVNAYVVKPVDFDAFAKAVKQLGVFWAAVNEPPPEITNEESSLQSDEVISVGKKGIKNEITAPHPALRG